MICKYCGSSMRDVFGNIAHNTNCPALRTSAASTKDTYVCQCKELEAENASLREQLAEVNNQLITALAGTMSKATADDILSARLQLHELREQLIGYDELKKHHAAHHSGIAHAHQAALDGLEVYKGICSDFVQFGLDNACVVESTIYKRAKAALEATNE